MSVVTVKTIGGSSITKSYDAIQDVQLSYLVRSDEPNPVLAMREAMAADDGVTRVPQYLERAYRTVSQFATKHTARIESTEASGVYNIRVDVTFEGAALLESGFILQARCSGEVERKSTDIAGQTLVVGYTPDGGATVNYQIGEADFYTPVVDLTARGFYQTDKPLTDVVGKWISRVNATEFAGFQEGEVMCTAVDFEPHNLAVSPAIYSFIFSLRAKASTYWGTTRLYPWDAKILYKDDATNLPPYDVTPTNGFLQAGMYERLDFATTAPIGVPSES